MSKTFNCPACGAPLDYDGGPDLTFRCPFCGNAVIVPPELRTGPAAPAPEPGDARGALRRVRHLLESGNKLEAIRVYREAFGVDLAKAKNEVERMEAASGTFEVTPVAVQVTTGARVSQPETSLGPGCVLAATGVIVLFVGVAAVLTFLSADGSNAIQSALLGTQTPTPTLTFTPSPTREPTGTPVPTSTPGYASGVLEFGEEGTGPGFFDDARSIGVDGAGNVYVGDYDGRVQVFDGQGNFLNQWRVDAVESFLSDLDVDSQGTVYAVYAGQIYRFQGVEGEPLGTVDYAAGPGFQSVGLIESGGFAAAWNKDWLGGLFTGSWVSQDDIVLFDAEGRVVRVLPRAVSSLSGDSELHTTLAVDRVNEPNLYALAEFNGTLFAVTQQGQYYFQIADEHTRSALDLATDLRGYIYIINGAGDIAVYDDQLSYVDSIDVDGRAWGIAVTDQNEIFVAARSRVIKFVLNR